MAKSDRPSLEWVQLPDKTVRPYRSYPAVVTRLSSQKRRSSVSQLRLFLVAASAVAALAVPGAVGAGGTVTQPLIATVGTRTAGETPVISLTDSTGAKITHLDTGAYTITVHDFATTHNFHLLGPGVDKGTGVETTADQTWDVVIVNGTYRYFCDIHTTSMRGSFTAGLSPDPR